MTMKSKAITELRSVTSKLPADLDPWIKEIVEGAASSIVQGWAVTAVSSGRPVVEELQRIFQERVDETASALAAMAEMLQAMSDGRMEEWSREVAERAAAEEEEG